MKPLVLLENISFPPYLKDISFEVYRNQILTIIGPNGAGKSTLLKVILGFIKTKIGKYKIEKKLKIGYMPQKIVFDARLPLTVERFLKLSNHANEINDILTLMNIIYLKYRSMHVLSGGELQRVLLARALLGVPDLLILDEPVQGVDVVGQTEINKLIYEVKEKFMCGIILVSHDLHFVLGASDHVICLNQHICCQGRPEHIRSNPEYLRLFKDFHPYDLVPYQHSHDHTHSHDCEDHSFIKV